MIHPSQLLPGPIEVLKAFPVLWYSQGLGVELWTSAKLSLVSLFFATTVSLALAYASEIPAFRSFVKICTKARFLGLAGLTLMFLTWVDTGFQLKVLMLSFTISTFFLTSMEAAIAQIPESQKDYAKTLRLSGFQRFLQVTVLGTLDQAFELLRQNAAIGWMMLTSVEAISRADGGVGAMLLAQNKHFHIDAVFAIQICILLVGLLQDFGIAFIKNIICPYTKLELGGSQ